MVHKVLHADDTPHSIALGVSIATFIAILPLIGIQMIVSVALAALFRANKAVCIPIVWITNPFTAGPIYWTCIVLGQWVLGTRHPLVTTERELEKLSAHATSASWLELRFWTDLLYKLIGLGVELWIGSVIFGAVLALIAYPATRSLVSRYRERRRRRTLQRQLLRSRIVTSRPDRQSEVA